jgi:starch synthase
MARAVQAHRQPVLWRQLIETAMAQDFSWEGAATRYMALYASLARPAAARQ